MEPRRYSFDQPFALTLVLRVIGIGTCGWLSCLRFARDRVRTSAFVQSERGSWLVSPFRSLALAVLRLSRLSPGVHSGYVTTCGIAWSQSGQMITFSNAGFPQSSYTCALSSAAHGCSVVFNSVSTVTRIYGPATLDTVLSMCVFSTVDEVENFICLLSILLAFLVNCLLIPFVEFSFEWLFFFCFRKGLYQFCVTRLLWFCLLHTAPFIL